MHLPADPHDPPVPASEHGWLELCSDLELGELSRCVDFAVRHDWLAPSAACYVLFVVPLLLALPLLEPLPTRSLEFVRWLALLAVGILAGRRWWRWTEDVALWRACRRETQRRHAARPAPPAPVPAKARRPDPVSA